MEREIDMLILEQSMEAKEDTTVLSSQWRLTVLYCTAKSLDC